MTMIGSPDGAADDDDDDDDENWPSQVERLETILPSLRSLLGDSNQRSRALWLEMSPRAQKCHLARRQRHFRWRLSQRGPILAVSFAHVCAWPPPAPALAPPLAPDGRRADGGPGDGFPPRARELHARPKRVNIAIQPLQDNSTFHFPLSTFHFPLSA